MMNTTENNNNINNNGQLQVFQNEAFGQVRVIMKEMSLGLSVKK